ncbi:ornithine carbamoyltransferase [Actinoallomurus rhizosphaericola]|uniref:ornithine carbamoyltransferase n=1 Tax=Actinoallomurus rhizosphaericola TaxID=2952536 RepID=UPI0020936A8F|nr:ornithine carbamoyltransferase [Actinoallomurus rhizosphaericola]MCO5995874.1 ornithine carbamoyltransferase [Actinoallomurus rhizosphaericola]
MRHLISVSDLPDDDLHDVVARAVRFAAGHRERSLAGRIVGTYFRKTSTRTRTAFTAGALRLGAQVIAYGPEDMQLVTGETAEDTGRVLSGMIDALVARTTGSTEELLAFAAQDTMAVINAMSAAEHPTQALADLTTLQEHFGRIEDLRVLYVGEGNNSATALALALSRYPGVHLELRTPPGYGLPAEYTERARANAERSGAVVTERHDMRDLPGDFDAIYTTRWQTTGTSKPDPDWRRVFAPFQVSAELWETSPKAVFMHDLPAHRGDEVTADVLDGPASVAFRQAEHKMHSAMAALEWCLA